MHFESLYYCKIIISEAYGCRSGYTKGNFNVIVTGYLFFYYYYYWRYHAVIWIDQNSWKT